MNRLNQRIIALEKRFPTATVHIPTIKEVIDVCPCEESREAATLLIQAVDPALFDIQWVMIDDAKGIHRTMVHIVEDLATHHGEPFDWIKDDATHGVVSTRKEKWSGMLTVCMLLAMAITLDHPNHDRTIDKINRLIAMEHR